MSILPKRGLAPALIRPAGRSAWAEAAIQPAIVLGSSILVCIGCFVLAQPQIAALASGSGSGLDVAVVFLVAGLGMLLDLTMIITSTRLRMHLARGKRDRGWAAVVGVMLALILTVEGMTLLYFGYIVAPAAVPPGIVPTIQGIHNILFFIRYALPPFILAFLTAGVLPLTIEPDDRDRATKATTSQAIAALEHELVQVALAPDATRAERIQALADQLAIFEHASHATPDEIARNAELIRRLRAQTAIAPDQSCVTSDARDGNVTQENAAPDEDEPPLVPALNGHTIRRGRAPHVTISSDALRDNE